MEKTNISKAKENVFSRGKYRDFLSKIFERDFKVLDKEREDKIATLKADFVRAVRTDPNFMKYPEYEMDLFEWKEDSPAGDLTWNPEMLARPINSRPTMLAGAGMAGLPPLPSGSASTPQYAMNRSVTSNSNANTRHKTRPGNISTRQNNSGFNRANLHPDSIEFRFD